MARPNKSAELKRKIFAAEYALDRNATRAAIAAGYSEKTAGQAGHRLLKDSEVSEMVEDGHSERAERLQINADYVIEGIRSTVDRCLTSEEPNYSAAFKGYELLGKYLKLFTERVENVDSDGKPLRTVKVLLMGAKTSKMSQI